MKKLFFYALQENSGYKKDLSDLTKKCIKSYIGVNNRGVHANRQFCYFLMFCIKKLNFIIRFRVTYKVIKIRKS